CLPRDSCYVEVFMNWYRRQVNAVLDDARPGAPSATELLEKLHADHREIEKAIAHLQRVQRMREVRLNRFGTSDLPFDTPEETHKKRYAAIRSHAPRRRTL